MKSGHYWLLLSAFICLLLSSRPSQAQKLTTGSQGCRVSAVQRTITFCAPAEGGTITEQFHPFFFVTDSLPYTVCTYEDGRNLGCVPGPDAGTGWNALFGENPGWHRIAIVVFDSQGTFKNWLRFRVGVEPQCTVPSADRQILICNPVAGNVTSPLHIVGVANSTSVPAEVMIAYVDNFQVQLSRTAAEGGPNSANAPTISTYVPVPLGKHTVALQVVDQNNNKFSVTETVNVVSAPQQD